MPVNPAFKASFAEWRTVLASARQYRYFLPPNRIQGVAIGIRIAQPNEDAAILVIAAKRSQRH